MCVFLVAKLTQISLVCFGHLNQCGVLFVVQDLYALYITVNACSRTHTWRENESNVIKYLNRKPRARNGEWETPFNEAAKNRRGTYKIKRVQLLNKHETFEYTHTHTISIISLCAHT